MDREEIIGEFSKLCKEHSLESGTLLLIIECCIRELNARGTIGREAARNFMKLVKEAEKEI